MPFLGVSQPTLGNTALLAKMDLENNNPKAVYDLLYGTADLDAGNNSLSPPVPMYKALITALQDDWNASSLQNMTVHIHLSSCLFFDNVSGNDVSDFIIRNNLTLPGWGIILSPMRVSGSGLICDIPTPLDDYSPKGCNGITIRNLWVIVITDNNVHIPGCPNPMYYIDAATGESIWPGPLG